MTHVIIVFDTFSYEDYPVNVMPNEDVKQKSKEYSENMQRVMEIYNLDMDIELQLDQGRAYNISAPCG